MVGVQWGGLVGAGRMPTWPQRRYVFGRCQTIGQWVIGEGLKGGRVFGSFDMWDLPEI